MDEDEGSEDEVELARLAICRVDDGEAEEDVDGQLILYEVGVVVTVHGTGVTLVEA